MTETVFPDGLGGTPIGQTTPAAGKFTTLEATSAALQTLAAAGATQGNAAQITGSVVIVTVTASTQGVKLPAAASGLFVRLHAQPDKGVKVYPATGDKIGSAATNAAVLVAANKGQLYQAVDATTWRVVV